MVLRLIDRAKRSGTMARAPHSGADSAPDGALAGLSYWEGSAKLWFYQRERRRKLQVDHQLNAAIQLVEQCGIFC